LNVPSFILVGLTHRWVRRLRDWRWAGLMLDAVNAAALGLMAAVSYSLAVGTLTSATSLLLAVAAFVALLRWRISPVWIVLAGAVLGRLFW
jgi:chromate transporter